MCGSSRNVERHRSHQIIVTMAAAISGILIGAPTLRLRGDYLAIVTLGFGEITYICLVNLDRPINITGGPNGLIAIDPPSFFGYIIERNTQYYYLFLLTLGAVVLASLRLRDSRIGWAWQAIREDELAAEAMGVNTTVAKLQAFAIGASIAGFAGGLLASWQRSVFPDNFLFQESINILAMVILGGMGNVFGVILGAAVIVWRQRGGYGGTYAHHRGRSQEVSGEDPRVPSRARSRCRRSRNRAL